MTVRTVNIPAGTIDLSAPVAMNALLPTMAGVPTELGHKFPIVDLPNSLIVTSSVWLKSCYVKFLGGLRRLNIY